MRVQFASDLHMEFERARDKKAKFKLPVVPSRDLLILAGDLGRPEHLIHLLHTQLEYSPVIVVLGNHDFYGATLPQMYRHWHQFAEAVSEETPNPLWVLQNEEVTYKGVRFLGCTLWTDINKGDWFARQYVKNGMLADMQLIREFNVDVWLEEHAKSVAWLDSAMDKDCVVVTHHMPHLRSMNLRWANHPLNPGFMSDLSELIEKHKPRFWCHGHTHDSCRYYLNDRQTLVACNPRGYWPRELNKSFSETECVTLSV